VNKNEKEGGFYLSYFEEHLPEELAGRITPQQKQHLEELFGLCQKSNEMELKNFWKRVDGKPAMAEWLESYGNGFGRVTPAAWVRDLAEKERNGLS